MALLVQEGWVTINGAHILIGGDADAEKASDKSWQSRHEAREKGTSAAHLKAAKDAEAASQAHYKAAQSASAGGHSDAAAHHLQSGDRERELAIHHYQAARSVKESAMLLVEAREAQEPQVQRPTLKSGYLALALKLQEAASDLTASTVGQKLHVAIQAAHKGTGKYASYLDHAGDGDSGDVYYQCGTDTMSCPYEVVDNGDGVAPTAKLDMDSARKVAPVVTYLDMPDDDEDDGMANMYEAWKRDGIYTGDTIPLCERFVSKAERDQMPEGNFAGKGKSYPINKPGDIMAAVHSIGRAGAGNYGPAALKANIIRIAKKLGWTKYLPKAWQGTDAKEAAKKMKTCPDCDGDGKCSKCNGLGKAGSKDCPECGGDGDCPECDGKGKVPAAKEALSYRAKDGAIRVTESTAFAEDLVSIREAASAQGGPKLIKLISPGKGSTAFYTAEMLKRDGPTVFKAGTPMRIDHPTQAEEAARPEGSVKDWGAVLADDAKWLESYVSPSTGKDNGPGLYASIKPFSDHAQTIEEKGPYAGVSIAAWGEPLKENGRVVMKQGVPVLTSLKAADGVDMVTRAGAGGLFVSEAARAATTQTQEASMDAEEKLLLQRLVEKDIRRDAITEGVAALAEVELPNQAKMYIVETVVDRGVPKKDGALDSVKLKEAINAEARRFGGAIGAGPRVTGMGVAPVVEITEAQRAAQKEARKAEDELYKESWATLLDEQPDAEGKLKLAEIALRGRTA